jgi:hypothetical protein
VPQFVQNCQFTDISVWHSEHATTSRRNVSNRRTISSTLMSGALPDPLDS